MNRFFWGTLFFLSSLISANSDPVIWSGVGYFVDSGKTSLIYPNLTSLEKDLNLAKLFSEKFSADENIIIGGSENRSSEEGLNSTLLAITSEKIFSNYRGKVGGSHLCYRTYLLSSQVVLYSINDKKILKAFPSTIKKTYIDPDNKNLCKNSSVEANLHKSRFADILWGSDFAKKGIGEEFVNNYSSSNLNSEGMLEEQIIKILNLENVFSKGNQPIGVRQVSISDYANNQLVGKGDFSPHQDYAPNNFLNSKELKEWLGAEFSKWLSQDLKISIVPFYEGEGLTLNIGTTFSNSAEALNLKKPELSYGFDYVLRGFRKADVGETQTQKGSVWSVYSGIKFGVVLGEGPEDIKNLATMPYTQSTSKQYNKTDVINDWDYFDETAQVGIREVSQNLIKQNKKWMKESSEISSKEFRNFAKTILNKVGYEK